MYLILVSQIILPLHFLTAQSQTPDTVQPPIEVLVTAPRETEEPFLDYSQAGPRAQWMRDSAAWLETIPGANSIRNGRLTGLSQLRGLHGDRVAVKIDGIQITPACSNHMDPPMHYCAPHAVDELKVYESIAPVSTGGDAPGGVIEAVSNHDRFLSQEETEDWKTGGQLSSHYDGRGDGYGSSGTIDIASRDWNLSYNGHFDTASDYQYPGGKVKASEYEISQHDFSIANLSEAGLIEVKFLQSNTQNAGTPTLLMDMVSDESFGGVVAWEKAWDEITLEARVYSHYVDHVMDGYTLRRQNPGNPLNEAPAYSRDAGFELASHIDLDREAIHRFSSGIDGRFSEFNVVQINRSNNTFLDLFNDSTRERVGLFGEWNADWDEQWTTQLGLRSDFIEMETGRINRTNSAIAAADAAAFNAADRQKLFVNFDVVAKLGYSPIEELQLEAGFARKSRAPGYNELYNFTPVAATAGLADGRMYFGNLGLESEIAHILSFAAKARVEEWVIQCSPYYNRMTDYIQGRTTNRIVMGNPALQYDNFEDVEIYGVDFLIEKTFLEHLLWHTDLSYVRGRNNTLNDNLYRMPPLQGLNYLRVFNETLYGQVEMNWAITQDDVSNYNGEQTTSGYVTMNLRCGASITEHLKLEAGCENLLDHFYENHLDGINRVPNSDLAVGSRVPSPGRFAYGAVTVLF